MAKAYASAIFEAPVEAVWSVVRNFDGLPNWLPAVIASSIEGGRDADSVGCVRSLKLQGGGGCTERLLALDDSRYTLTYSFIEPAFPIGDYVSTLELIPVTSGERTFVHWVGRFEEKPEDAGKWQKVISQDVYAAGLASLGAKVAGMAAPAGKPRWDGMRPAKVFCSSVVNGPVAAVWQRVRDFAGMSDWHPDIKGMHMTAGARPDKVSGVRDFLIGDGRLLERLTYLSDAEHAFRYLIEQSPMPWLNYHAGVQLYPVTETNRTFAVWTADWVACANDDVALIPQIHTDVFQKAFDTLNERYFHG